MQEEAGRGGRRLGGGRGMGRRGRWEVYGWEMEGVWMENGRIGKVEKSGRMEDGWRKVE